MFEFRAVHYFEHAQNAHKCLKLFIIIYCKNFTDLNLLDLYLVIKSLIKAILIY